MPASPAPVILHCSTRRLPTIFRALNSNWMQSPWFRRALAVLAGVALALAFPRPGLAGLAWVAPALLLLAARSGRPFRLGYLAGFTHYLVSLAWLLHIPVKFYPILGWLALAAYLALFPAAWAWLCVRSAAARGANPGWLGRTGQAVLCAVLWVGLEMIIARLFTGFPWNLLGASQQKLLPLIQIASVTGIMGVSFVVIWFAASLLNAFDALLARPADRNVWLKELALPIFAIAILYALGLRSIATAPAPERTLRIALIQPSIPQTMIWNSAEAAPRLAELFQLTEAALTNKPDLVLWPEAAMPRMLRDDEAAARRIADLARAHRAWFIIGSDDFDLRGTNIHYYNSSFLVSPRGEYGPSYRKRRLVIFGEYVPLADWLPFIKWFTPISGGFTPGDRPVSFPMDTLHATASVLICFEDVFPHYAREHAGDDVDFLVNITNDGWFGEASAQWQHAASAAYRAVENGRPLVRCANNGLSCWIDRHGGLHNVFFDHSPDIYQAGYKIVNIPLPAAPARTFYTRHGDWFGWFCVVITGLVAASLLWSDKLAARRGGQ